MTDEIKKMLQKTLSPMFDDSFPRNHGKTWSLDDHWQLVELYNQPITWRSIAEKLGRTIPACQIRMRTIWIAFDLIKELDADSIMEKLAGGKKIHKEK